MARRHRRLRLVGRYPRPVEEAAETVAADLTNPDQTLRAVYGSSVVYLLAGLKYDTHVWAEFWPRIMNNAIEACKRAGARLIFFDNVYMYGRVSGPMTEETPFNPCSRKGDVRARIASMLLDEIRAGNLQAMIARSADFYGPNARTSLPGIMVFGRYARGASAMWLVNDDVSHSFTYTPDAAESLALLAESNSAWNQTWHVPTAGNPPTGKSFILTAATAFGVKPRYRVLRPPLLHLAGLFNADARETCEMLYQNDSPYVFDSGKFNDAFGFQPTAYVDGIRQAATAYAGLRRRIA